MIIPRRSRMFYSGPNKHPRLHRVPINNHLERPPDIRVRGHSLWRPSIITSRINIPFISAKVIVKLASSVNVYPG